MRYKGEKICAMLLAILLLCGTFTGEISRVYSEEAIEAARKGYDELTEKKPVKNLATLEAA